MEAPADERDERRKPEYLDLRETGDEADANEHHRAKRDGLGLGEELVYDVLAERLVVHIAHARHDHAGRDGEETSPRRVSGT